MIVLNSFLNHFDANKLHLKWKSIQFYLVKWDQEAAIGRGFHHHQAFFKGLFESFLGVLSSRFFAVFHKTSFKTSLKLMKKRFFEFFRVFLEKISNRDQTRDLLVTRMKPKTTGLRGMVLKVVKLDKSDSCYFSHEFILWVPLLHSGTIVIAGWWLSDECLSTDWQLPDDYSMIT